MGGRIIAGVVAFVVLVLLVQNYVLGNNKPGSDNLNQTGVVPTATLPAQTPEAISLGEEQTNGTPGAGITSTSSTYVVKDGDTLGSIATSFHVAPADQAAWIAQVLNLNNISDARLLQVGEELTIPTVQTTSTQAPTSASTPVAAATATPAASGGSGGTYTVVSGDTPLGIAQKFCVSNPTTWSTELVTLNSIDPNNLSVGQELQLPPGTPAKCQ